MTRIEHDLIFAIQAAQMGLVAKDVLIEAGLAWSRDRDQALRQLLIDRAGMSLEDVALLDRIVERMVVEDGGDPQRTLERLGGRDKVYESFGGPSARESAVVASILEATAEPGAPAPDWVTTEQPGRYAVRGEHGRGGIGRVLVAYDAHIGREIAMKELLPGAAPGTPPSGAGPSSAAAARFLREARVTGQLEHPNIVPVYEVGRRPDGTLYYTMRLVRGRTLADALKSCRSLAERLRLLPHFVDLCHAVAYAHSRGVIHRDLKTDNVMLGEFGETVVLDWGLAKVRDQVVSEERSPLATPDPLTVASDRTVDGRAIGTPAYMSPEQAEGRLEAIDERSDLWSLGAVLFELLTGRPPFVGVNAFEVIGKVIAEPVPSPRTLQPDVPPELASICEKALRRAPDQRYGSAKELAEEVAAFRSGARVRVYEYTSWELLKRFVARNRAVSAAALVLLVTLTAGSAVIFSAYRTADVSRRNEQTARLGAERSLAKEKAAQDLALVASRQLSWAYQAAAEREVARKDFLSARIYAAAALLHNSENPMSPFHFREARAGKAPGPDDGRFAAVQGILHAVATESRIARQWSLQTPPEKVFAVAYSPDGKRIAAGGGAGFLRLYDRTTGREVARLEGADRQGHPDDVYALGFSPDGKLLASAGEDRIVRLWDLAAGRPLHRLEAHQGPVLALAFSPDGRSIATAGKDHRVLLWERPAFTRPRELTGHTDMVNALAFSRTGDVLASAGSDQTVRIWRPAGPEPPLVLRSPKKGSVLAVALAPHEPLLATAGEDDTVRLWDYRTGQLVTELAGHTQIVRSLAFAPDGKLLVSASFDGTVRLFSLRQRTVVETLRGHGDRVTSVAFAPAGGEFVSAARDRSIRVWSLTRQPARYSLGGHRRRITDVATSPDGARVASVDEEHRLLVWSLPGRKVERTLTEPDGDLRCVAWSSDGALLAAGGARGAVRVHRATDGARLLAFDGPVGSAAAVAFAPRGRRLATAGADGAVRLWDPEAATPLVARVPVGGDVTALAYAPDGERLAAGGSDGMIRLVSRDGTVLPALGGGAGAVAHLAFSPDGRTLAVGRVAPEGAVRDQADVDLLDAATGEVRHRLTGHQRAVHRVAFSPAGDLLISAGGDFTVRLWEVATGRAVQLLSVARPHAVAFARRGAAMVMSDWAKLIVSPVLPVPWTRPAQALLRQASAEAGLTLDEFTLRPGPGGTP